MRFYVFSDSHGAEQRVAHFLATRQDADGVCFLGDGLAGMRRVAAAFPAIPFSMVPGNCDFGAGDPEELLIRPDGVRVLLAHGHRFDVKYGLDRYIDHARHCHARVALFGHTHDPLALYQQGLWLLNPGSVRYTGTFGSCGILDIVPQGISVSTVCMR